MGGQGLGGQGLGGPGFGGPGFGGPNNFNNFNPLYGNQFNGYNPGFGMEKICCNHLLNWFKLTKSHLGYQPNNFKPGQGFNNNLYPNGGYPPNGQFFPGGCKLTIQYIWNSIYKSILDSNHFSMNF